LRANGPAVNAVARPVQYDSRPELGKIDAKATENGAKWLSQGMVGPLARATMSPCKRTYAPQMRRRSLIRG